MYDRFLFAIKWSSLEVVHFSEEIMYAKILSRSQLGKVRRLGCPLQRLFHDANSTQIQHELRRYRTRRKQNSRSFGIYCKNEQPFHHVVGVLPF